MTSDGIEAAVRGVIARRLQVPSWLLVPSVCLREDLASDAATIRDVVLAVEQRLGVRMEAHVLDEVRSYGDLVTATLDAIRNRRAELDRDRDGVPLGQVRIVGPERRVVERAGPLTPYLVEAVCEDARRAGPGVTVSVTVGEDATLAQIATLRERLGRLDRLGVAVVIDRRSPQPGSLRAGS